MSDSRVYYLFLGVHSFLIGLFPFFLPVFLVKNGYTLVDISWFVGVTGISFTFSLFVWDRFYRVWSLFTTILISFVVELILLFLLTLGWDFGPIAILAIVNGVYNCLFWMVQRILFFASVNSHNSGRRFGNLQIFVTIVLKAGIFTGGLILDNIGVAGVFMLSTCFVLLALYTLYGIKNQLELPSSLIERKAMLLKDIRKMRDKHRSRSVFIFDGVFLYLESYFWLITLFHLTSESFYTLSLLVIGLAIGFSVLFYLIKNRIDGLPVQRVYATGVVLYILSWLLRGCLDLQFDGAGLYLLLIGITFCTSFFRLVFNKRFFDLAQITTGYTYIFYKSYVSQFFLGVFFIMFAYLLPVDADQDTILKMIYLAAALIAPLYFMYCQEKTKKTVVKSVKVKESY